MRTPTKSRRPDEALLARSSTRTRRTGGRVGALLEEAPLLLGCAADIVARVSSLWTPGGEHRVPEDRGAASAQAPDDQTGDVSEAEMRAELDEARRRLAEVPAAQVVANHAMGLFELAAIHLS